MKPCFGYVRVSTVKQGDGVSLEAQREAIEAFATQNQLTISRWFEEKETAAKRGRPVFDAMVKDLLAGKAGGVITHKIDRTARNIADWAKIGELSDAGVDVHFATETLDFRSRGGRLSADIQAVIAADFIRNLREETIKGMTGRLKQGLYPFKAPLGYLDNGRGKPKTADPDRAKLVTQMFDLYATGTYSILTLRKEMIDRGLTNSAGREPSKHLIETMLSNPFYCGVIKIKRAGAVYDGIHEPLITAATFERVQAVKSGKAGKKVTRHNHLYRGLFRCAHCDRSMIPELQKGHVYYRCQTKGCATKTVRENVIETSIVEFLAGLRLSPAAIEQMVSEVAVWAEERHGDDRTRLRLQQKRQELADRMERLTDALIDRHIDTETYNQRRQSLLLDQRRLEEDIERMQQSLGSAERVRAFLELVKALAQLYETMKPPEKRHMVEIAFSNRQVRGKHPEFEPSDWLQPVRDIASASNGDPSPPNSRSCRQSTNCQIEALVKAAWSRELDQLHSEPTESSGDN